MEESFRRAVRVMTGRSLFRRVSHANRSRIEGQMSQSMAVNWSIALFEHLDAVLASPELSMAGSEAISYSGSAFRLSEKEFPKLEAETRERFGEFRTKWAQRFSTSELSRLLLEGSWIREEERGWLLAVKNQKADINNFYLATVHLMVGDAEKLFVMMSSRTLRLQERLGKLWLEESATDAISKVLPCLEASLRKCEETIVSNLRETISLFAHERFAAAFSTKARAKHFPTRLACVRSAGRLWNLNGAYENAFLAYLDDFCDYVSGLSLLLEEWYRSKWSLFLRGFLRGQLDLFDSPPTTGNIQ